MDKTPSGPPRLYYFTALPLANETTALPLSNETTALPLVSNETTAPASLKRNYRPLSNESHTHLIGARLPAAAAVRRAALLCSPVPLPCVLPEPQDLAPHPKYTSAPLVARINQPHNAALHRGLVAPRSLLLSLRYVYLEAAGLHHGKGAGRHKRAEEAQLALAAERAREESEETRAS